MGYRTPMLWKHESEQNEKKWTWAENLKYQMALKKTIYNPTTMQRSFRVQNHFYVFYYYFFFFFSFRWIVYNFHTFVITKLSLCVFIKPQKWLNRHWGFHTRKTTFFFSCSSHYFVMLLCLWREKCVDFSNISTTSAETTWISLIKIINITKHKHKMHSRKAS